MNNVLITIIIFITILNICVFLLFLSSRKSLRWYKDKLSKLITGDNVDMSIETLSLYYDIPEERIDHLLASERDYIKESKYGK